MLTQNCFHTLLFTALTYRIWCYVVARTEAKHYGPLPHGWVRWGVSGTTDCLGNDSQSCRPSRRVFLPRGLAIAIRRLGLILLLATGPNTAALAQSQNFIDFEEFSGPSFFTGIQPPLTVGLATFSGGQILDAATFLPVNPTIVYGTAFFCPGCLPTLTIEFAEPVSDLSIFLMNGQTFVVT